MFSSRESRGEYLIGIIFNVMAAHQRGGRENLSCMTLVFLYVADCISSTSINKEYGVFVSLAYGVSCSLLNAESSS